MNLVSKSLNGGSQSLPAIPTPFSIPSPQSHASEVSFPIIAIIGIIATAFLLVSYYIFVIKCCLNWQRIDILRRFFTSRNGNQDDPFMAYSPGWMETTRGLDESVIRSIPIFKFRKEGAKLASKDLGEISFCECAVCLNEFQEEERLKRIPNCSHVFHIDCIDVWLQNNANCPLCRTSISGTSRLFPLDHIIAPSSSPQDPTFNNNNNNNNRSNSCGSEGSVIDGDCEDYVVIELGNYGNSSLSNETIVAAQERLNPGALLPAAARRISPSPGKIEQRVVHKKGKKYNKVGSMGDECIDIRGQDNEFAIEPIRRSFSMDSSADRQLFLAIQDVVQQRRRVTEASSPVEGCNSNNSKNRRNFFSFGHGSKGSRSASVLPVHFEPC